MEIKKKKIINDELNKFYKDLKLIRSNVAFIKRSKKAKKAKRNVVSVSIRVKDANSIKSL